MKIIKLIEIISGALLTLILIVVCSLMVKNLGEFLESNDL